MRGRIEETSIVRITGEMRLGKEISSLQGGYWEAKEKIDKAPVIWEASYLFMGSFLRLRGPDLRKGIPRSQRKRSCRRGRFQERKTR